MSPEPDPMATIAGLLQALELDRLLLDRLYSQPERLVRDESIVDQPGHPSVVLRHEVVGSRYTLSHLTGSDDQSTPVDQDEKAPSNLK